MSTQFKKVYTETLDAKIRSYNAQLVVMANDKKYCGQLQSIIDKLERRKRIRDNRVKAENKNRFADITEILERR